jgi:glycosyltransferase involved in cell wall biosynthesis
MTAALPRVDALLPAWRAERFIEQTLDALAAQTWPNLHIVISDDASPDRTASLCEAFAARTPNARLIRQSSNLGWIGNSNALLGQTEGDYFFFALHDDLPHPRFVERMVEAMHANPRAVAAFSDLEQISTRRDTRNYALSELDGVTDPYERVRKLVLRQGRWWIAFRSLFRASVARRLSGMREHPGGDFCSDFMWLLGLAARGEFVRVPEVLMTRRQQEDGVSARWRYSLQERTGLLWGCLQEIQRSPLTTMQRLQLQALAVTSAAQRAMLGEGRKPKRI